MDGRIFTPRADYSGFSGRIGHPRDMAGVGECRMFAGFLYLEADADGMLRPGSTVPGESCGGVRIRIPHRPRRRKRPFEDEGSTLRGQGGGNLSRRLTAVRGYTVGIVSYSCGPWINSG